MLKRTHLLRRLPFVPMAMSSVENVEGMERCAQKQSHTGLPHMLKEPPYFISPKHDGVRVVTYVGTSNAPTDSTCFSRYGRPIHGMWWIEEELRLLRWLCGDPRLVLDGELYIHRGSNPHSGSGYCGKTGFLAIASLVHRLRSAKSACSTEEEVLRFVDTLPRMCVFDIVSYQPREVVRLRGDKGCRGLSQVERERMSMLREVMAANCITDLEMLRVIPCRSVFSQRLKAMHFLASLLFRAQSSTVLFPGRSLSASREAGQLGRDCGTTTPGTGKLGGKYVRLVDYSVVNSFEEAKNVYLNKYVSDGYEGAVIRSAANVYELREKEKGTLMGLMEPLLHSSEQSIIGAPTCADPKQPQRRRVKCLPHFHGCDKGELARAWDEEVLPSTAASSGAMDVDVIMAEMADHQEIANAVIEQSRQSKRRSTTIAKLLPFVDKEFAILRPLLKFPTNDSCAQNYIHIPLSSLEGGCHIITAPRKPVKMRCDRSDTRDTVAFYGLQCLSETGRVFNVLLPKMDSDKQQLLLNHLLQVTGADGGGKKRAARRTLTGLYATVKFPSLTAHGVPRFGQVKSIRGGKGWFL
ncbi:hypothetical protein ERJ75_001200100 [Trypanosoma vivax]|nr:hypothetical protein ERJ75_001200100 [Trypanosoma vivax]